MDVFLLCEAQFLVLVGEKRKRRKKKINWKKTKEKSIRETLFYSFQFSAEIFDNKA